MTIYGCIAVSSDPGMWSDMIIYGHIPLYTAHATIGWEVSARIWLNMVIYHIVPGSSGPGEEGKMIKSLVLSDAI